MEFETSDRFDAGVEVMRSAAINAAKSWHMGAWEGKTSLTNEDVHDLINGIIGDIAEIHVHSV